MNSFQTLDNQERVEIDGGFSSSGSLSDLIYLLYNTGKILV